MPRLVSPRRIGRPAVYTILFVSRKLIDKRQDVCGINFRLERSKYFHLRLTCRAIDRNSFHFADLPSKHFRPKSDPSKNNCLPGKRGLEKKSFEKNTRGW